MVNYMDIDNLIRSYKDNFIKGVTYNYYLDTLRYTKQDNWITTDEWIELAELCIDRQNNILQALEVLIREKFEQYYSLADVILMKWYRDGAYDMEYYFDILAAMPREHPIRKEILADYTDFILNYSSINTSSMRSSLVKANDLEFCEIYGKFLDEIVYKYRNNDSELEILIEKNYLIDLGDKAHMYTRKETLGTVIDFLVRYLKKDKEIAYSLLEGHDSFPYRRRLWIADRIAFIAYSLSNNELIEYLKDQEWYWVLLFDKDHGYEDYNNTNLLVWSQINYTKDVESRAKELLSKKQLDGAIALNRRLV